MFVGELFIAERVSANVITECPDREDVLVATVADRAAKVEHTRDTLLTPISVGLLFADQRLNTALDSSLVFGIGSHHQGVHGPRGVDDVRFFVLHVSSLVA